MNDLLKRALVIVGVGQANGHALSWVRAVPRMAQFSFFTQFAGRSAESPVLGISQN